MMKNQHNEKWATYLYTLVERQNNERRKRKSTKTWVFEPQRAPEGNELGIAVAVEEGRRESTRNRDFIHAVGEHPRYQISLLIAHRV